MCGGGANSVINLQHIGQQTAAVFAAELERISEVAARLRVGDVVREDLLPLVVDA
jgi:hypothetical protein